METSTSPLRLPPSPPQPHKPTLERLGGDGEVVLFYLLFAIPALRNITKTGFNPQRRRLVQLVNLLLYKLADLSSVDFHKIYA